MGRLCPVPSGRARVFPAATEGAGAFFVGAELRGLGGFAMPAVLREQEERAGLDERLALDAEGPSLLGDGAQNSGRRAQRGAARADAEQRHSSVNGTSVVRCEELHPKQERLSAEGREWDYQLCQTRCAGSRRRWNRRWSAFSLVGLPAESSFRCGFAARRGDALSPRLSWHRPCLIAFRP